ncbi:hypothetical protein MBLNU13_g08141t1 [Cladosporium sp. NU13]
MDEYGAFSTHGLWRPSIFTVSKDPEDTIFEGLQLNELSGLASKHADDSLFEGLLEGFDLPPLEDIPAHAGLESGDVLLDLNAKALAETDISQESQTIEHDVWHLEAEPLALPAEPRLHTWEAFQLKGDQPASPIYLSEAGVSAFNAVYRQREQSTGIIQHDVTLRACCSLILGRSSTLFRWDPVKMLFAPILNRVSLSGLSLTGSHSLLQQFINTGTSFRQLYIFATQFSVKDCTAMVALRRSVGDLLDHVERHICGRLVFIRSLLQLQQVVDRPCYILEYVGSLIQRLRHARTDEALISMLSDEVTALAEGGSVLVSVMKQVLLLVSMPWLQTLAEDVGLAPDPHMNRPSTKLELTASTNQPGLPGAHFLMAQDVRSISSVRHSISLLRQHVPSHPLVRPDSSILERDVLHVVSRCNSEDIMRKADEYKNRMSAAVSRHCRGMRGDGVSTPILDDPMEIETTAFVDQGPFALSTLEDIAALEDDAPQEASSEAHVYLRLRSDLAAILAVNEEGMVNDVLQLSSDLLAPLRPFIDVQAALVNGAVMSYVFDTYRLRDHLELHRSYHLFGNGDFVTRLATALFSGDVQTAERKRGNIPTSETMGLRLDSRESQRWPPASSELRLTLLNVLSESYAPNTPHEDNMQLPGGLSFAIRELTDAEIDRVMDPTSMYALDFLRLQYTPPAPIADIFTAAIAQHYDFIFRTLLVHVRVLHATSQLSMFCNKYKQQSHSSVGNQTVIRRFAWKARQLSTTIFSHFTDTVIAEAWNSFSERLNELQPRQEAEQISQSVDLHRITRLHERCLDDIRSKMFLRHKHAKVRSVLEELAAIVIKTTLIVVHDAAGQSSVAEQEGRFDRLSVELRSSLEVLANKPAKEDRGDVHSQRTHTESDAAKVLLARLGWQGNAVMRQ